MHTDHQREHQCLSLSLLLKKRCAAKSEMLTRDMVNWDPIILQSTKNALGISVRYSGGRLKDSSTKCEIPLAPPPPSTTPMDFPQIRLASRAKSFVWGGRCGRAAAPTPRYFRISLSSICLKFLKAATAPGSWRSGGAFVTGRTKPYSDLKGSTRRTCNHFVSVLEAPHENAGVSTACALAGELTNSHKAARCTNLQPFTS